MEKEKQDKFYRKKKILNHYIPNLKIKERRKIEASFLGKLRKIIVEKCWREN